MKRSLALLLITVFCCCNGLNDAYAYTAMQNTAASPALKCSDPDPENGSAYYSIDLVTTRNIPGTGAGSGKAVMQFKPGPFGISVSEDGSYIHELKIQLNRITKPESGSYVAWVTTPSLDRISRLGVLDDDFKTTGTVSWNKYIVVITLEQDISEKQEIWEGPIAFRGLSRSGLMHTMAGHGPFEQEPCAKFGYY